MADLEIWKGGFKVIGAALKAAEGGSRGSGFSRGVWGHAPPENCPTTRVETVGRVQNQKAVYVEKIINLSQALSSKQDACFLG